MNGKIQRTGIWTAEAPHHECTPETCPEPGSYYVTCIDGPNLYYMSGPYPTHAGALARVDAALSFAHKNDRSGRAWFMSWGTARFKDDERRPGNLNKAGFPLYPESGI